MVEPVGAGNPNDLLLKFTPPNARLNPGDRVVTRGTVSDTDRYPSLYPPGIPIGVVTRIDNEGTDTEEVHLRPHANMRSLDFVQVLTRTQEQDGVSADSAKLAGRLVALALAGVIVQTSAISQLPIAGANADLSPLLVMAVGLLCGSLAGGCFGFGVGLFADIVSLQTLGVSSLVLLGVGYGAGRLREARDPEGSLVPLAAGAAATLIFSVGFALMQFLLGSSAPVSWALLRQILATLVINALIALPVYAVVRRSLLSALPEDPRRRRRRAYTTGGLSPLSRS